MQSTHAAEGAPRNRNRFTFSFPTREERRRDSLLRTAWMLIVQAFPCRPSPRGPWDETATGDQTPWKYVTGPVRTAIASAVMSGDRELTEETVERACEFCDALKADFRSMLPPREEESVIALAIRETEFAGKAKVEEIALVANPTPTEAERAILPLTNEASALVRLINCCQRLARQPQMRIAR